VKLRLRPVEEADIAPFFAFHSDEEARRMAAFGGAGPPEMESFAAKWRSIIANRAALTRTILVEEETAGYVAHFEHFGQPAVSYWIGRAWWGRGIATAALAAFLPEVAARPLFARAAKDNLGSLRVLEKNGFQKVGEDRGFADARGAETEEWILVLR
jgi:RimJ/RimL family protein N-acetyltransferase